MRRRSSRRMWHSLLALVPLPLIGLGYCVAFPGNHLATEVELSVSDPNSVTTAARTADASATPSRISSQADRLFLGGGKGPRADHFLTAEAAPDRAPHLVAASLAGAPTRTHTVSGVSRDAKADRLKATTEVALRVPAAGRSENSLFMNAIILRPSTPTSKWMPSGRAPMRSPIRRAPRR